MYLVYVLRARDGSYFIEPGVFGPLEEARDFTDYLVAWKKAKDNICTIVKVQRVLKELNEQ